MKMKPWRGKEKSGREGERQNKKSYREKQCDLTQIFVSPCQTVLFFTLMEEK